MVRRGRRGFHGRTCDNSPGCGSTGRAGVLATAPWLVLLLTVIGTPLLGALLFFFVPFLRVAKRLGIWLSSSNPPWWVQNIFAALLVGGIVAVVSILWQESISDNQATQATRLENLRFVRQLSSQKDVTARPFSDLDLQGQNLRDLISQVRTSTARISSTQTWTQLTSAPHRRGEPTWPAPT
jgi:uncharacterized protein (TIGR03382 family)